MKKRLLCILVLTMAGCTALMSKEPITKSKVLAQPPAVAYQRASEAMARLGGEITTSDPQSHMLSAKVHNAVILTVLVSAIPEGSRIEATGTLMPNKIAIGTFDEVDQYLALVR